jgi:hypothetical protein
MTTPSAPAPPSKRITSSWRGSCRRSRNSPRSHKFTPRIEITALDVLEALVAVHESLVGTTRKRLAARIDSANWGEADSNAAAR